MTRNKKNTPAADSKKNIFVITAAFPTFDTIAAIALARVYGKPSGFHVMWAPEHRADALELQRIAETNGWTVVDIRSYEQTPAQYSRVPKLLQAMDEAIGSDDFLRLIREDPKVRQIVLDLRANNGAADELNMRRGGYLKQLPFSFVALIRELWNCLGDEEVPSHEDLMNRWLDLAEVCIAPPTRTGEREQVNELTMRILSQLGVGRQGLNRHSFTLAGHIARLWEAGWSWDRIREHTSFWRHMFRIAGASRLSDEAAWDHIEHTVVFRGLRVAYLKIDDDRVARKCWRVGPKGDQVHNDVLIVFDVRTRRPVIMANPGADITALAEKLQEMEPGRWHYENRYRLTDPTKAVFLMNGGASRIVEPTSLSFNNLLGLLNVHMCPDEEASQAAREARKAKRQAREEQQRSRGGDKRQGPSFGRPQQRGGSSRNRSGGPSFGRPQRHSGGKRRSGNKGSQSQPQQPKRDKKIIVVDVPTGDSGVSWRRLSASSDALKFNPFAGLRLVDASEE